jgi:drug/metabolite transporter (DMT)-like permease
MAAPLRRGGVGFALACSASFSVNTVCSRIAFAHGADAPTVNVARYGCVLLILLLVFTVRGHWPILPRRERLIGLGIGGFFFMTSFGFLGSLQYIPVSVAVLVIYTYPLLVGLIEWLGGRERLGVWRVSALLLGFLGLALALDPWTAAPPDWRGVALAGLGSLGMASLVTSSARLLLRVESGRLNLHIVLGAVALFLVNLALVGGPSWPQGGTGWTAFGGLIASYVLGQLMLMAAIGRAGAVATVAIMNLEPILTIALAILVLGERPNLLQGLGAALVLTALLLVRRGEYGAPAGSVGARRG